MEKTMYTFHYDDNEISGVLLAVNHQDAINKACAFIHDEYGYKPIHVIPDISVRPISGNKFYNPKHPDVLITSRY